MRRINISVQLAVDKSIPARVEMGEEIKLYFNFYHRYIGLVCYAYQNY